jgi:hypothetical protein
MQVNLVNSIETCGRTLLDTIDHLLDYTKINNANSVARQDTDARREARVQGVARTKKMNEHVIAKNLTPDIDICAITEEVLTAVSAGYDIHRLAASRSRGGRRALDSSYADDTSGALSASQADKSHFNNVVVSIDIANISNWRFRTEAGAWRRVVMNIFSNSLKYTEKGFIRVSLRADPLPPKHGIDRSMITLKISDSGIGMSKTYLQEKLFTPFAQEDQLAPGTGLGLSIISKIIKHMGGKIEIRSSRSTLSHGTEVCVSIPMTQSSNAEVPRSLEYEDLDSVVQVTRGMDVCVSTLENTTVSGIQQQRRRSPTTDSQELLILKELCRNWYHMRVHSSGQTQKSPDLYLIIENEANHQSLRNGNLFATLRRRSAVSNSEQPLRAIVLCRTPSSTHTLERSVDESDSRQIIEFICQPCGPRKLGKTLLRCFVRRGIKPNMSPPIKFDDNNPPSPPNGIELSAGVPIPRCRTPITLPPTPPTDIQSPSSPSASPPTNNLATVGPSEDAGPFLLVDDNHINVQVCSAAFHPCSNYSPLLTITSPRFWKCI